MKGSKGMGMKGKGVKSAGGGKAGGSPTRGSGVPPAQAQIQMAPPKTGKGK